MQTFQVMLGKALFISCREQGSFSCAKIPLMCLSHPPLFAISCCRYIGIAGWKQFPHCLCVSSIAEC